MNNQELDKWLAEHIMGWRLEGDWWMDDTIPFENKQKKPVYPMSEGLRLPGIPQWI